MGVICQHCGKSLSAGSDVFAFCSFDCADKWSRARWNIAALQQPDNSRRSVELKPIILSTGELTRGNVEWFQ